MKTVEKSLKILTSEIWKIFSISEILQSAPNDPKLNMLNSKNQTRKVPYNAVPRTVSPKFSSILLNDRLFSRYSTFQDVHVKIQTTTKSPQLKDHTKTVGGVIAF